MSRQRQLFELVCDLPEAERESALAQAGADASERAEVLALLAGDDQTHTLSRAPLARLAAQFAETELRVGDRLGSWKLLEEIGRGGMGAVFLAERVDGHFSQRAAVKLIRGLADDLAAARFARERQTLANLQHPQIARLLDGGATPEGQPYLVMEYVEGIALERWCEGRALPVRLALFVSICRAVQFAHSRLVVHCDLKPSNVMVDAAGRPVLLDFGIARRLDSTAVDADAQASSNPLTPRYASPEQRRGEAPGTATDVHALGLMLYELCADEPPPEARGECAPQPSLATSRVPWRRRLRGDLDAIVARACAAEASARYDSAAALADDVERFLGLQPVAARRATPGYVFGRLLRRRWHYFALGTLMFAVAAGFTWRLFLAERHAREQAGMAQRESRTARRATDFLVSAFALSDPTRSERHDFSARDVLDRGAARIETELGDEPRVRARLLDALGQAYLGIGEGDAGATLLEEAARLALDPAVDDPLAAARSLRARAAALIEARLATPEVEDAASRALDLTRRHAADDPAQLADAWRVYASALNVANRPQEEILAAAREAFRLRQASDPAPRARAAALVDWCDAVQAARTPAEAQPHCEEAVRLYRLAGDTRSAEYRHALAIYGSVLYYLDTPAAHARNIEVRRERLEVTRALFGEDSSTFAADRVVLAQSLAFHGAFEEAEALLAHALPVLKARNGEASTQFASALFTSGLLEHLRGRFAPAIERIRAAEAIFAQATGEGDNGRLPVIRIALANALIAGGDTGDEPLAIIEAKIATITAHDPESAGLPHAWLPLALWHVGRGEFESAEIWLDRFDAVAEHNEAELHARAATGRARIAAARGDLHAAADAARRAYELTLASVGEHHPRTAREALAWARARRLIGETAEADALEAKYRATFERSYPADSDFRRDSGRTTT